MSKVSTLLVNLFELRDQTHIIHLQTESYAVHKALNRFYDELIEMIDAFAECYMGKYGRFYFDGSRTITLENETDLSIVGLLDKHLEFLTNDVYELGIINRERDPELEDLIFDIRNLINKTKYLLTLK